MSFLYRNVTISGSVPGNEGVTDFLQELKDFMTTAGWSLTEDRTDQDGLEDCKLVMQSNGESGEYPTFFLVAHSGSDYTSFYMATAYDTGTHDVATTGIQTNAYGVAMARFVTESESDFQVWFSGDSEALAIVSDRIPGPDYDSVLIGRLNSFMSTADNPYPLYIISANGAVIITVDSNGTVSRGTGGNPPFAFDGSNENRVRDYTYLSTNQPYTFGTAESVFLATPLIFNYTWTAATQRKGMAGTVRNAWRGAGSSMGMLSNHILTASGTSGVQTYKAFVRDTADSLIIRVT